MAVLDGDDHDHEGGAKTGLAAILSFVCTRDHTTDDLERHEDGSWYCAKCVESVGEEAP